MRNRYTGKTLVLEIAMIFIALLYLLPLYLLVITAFKHPSDVSNALIPPASPTLDNMVIAIKQGGIGTALLNSAIVTVGSVVLLVVTSSLAAYPLARLSRAWSRGTYLAFLFGLMLPVQLSLIPLYLAMRDIGLTGSLFGLILVYGGVQVPFCTFLYTEFLRSVPRDYDEAASIDGASRFRIYVDVLFPLLRPVTGTVVVLNAVIIWNDFYIPLLYLSGTAQRTLPVAMVQFVGVWNSQWNVIFSELILGAAPILVVFMVMQKAIFRGYSFGIKG